MTIIEKVDMKDVTDLLNEDLGYCGRMISGSKSGYTRNNPEGCPIFNANIVTENAGKFFKVWHGDLDLSKDFSIINKVAKQLDSTKLYVLREMDARFEHEDSPNINAYVICTDGEISTFGVGSFDIYEMVDGHVKRRIKDTDLF